MRVWRNTPLYSRSGAISRSVGYIYSYTIQLLILRLIPALLCLTITCLPVSTSLVTPLLTAVPDPYACGSLFGLPGSTVTQVLLALRATNGTAFTPSVSLTHPSFPPTTSLSDIQAIIIEFLHPSSTIRLGTKYWSCPGPFVSYRIPGIGGQFLGTWQVLLQVSFGQTLQNPCNSSGYSRYSRLWGLRFPESRQAR